MRAVFSFESTVRKSACGTLFFQSAWNRSSQEAAFIAERLRSGEGSTAPKFPGNRTALPRYTFFTLPAFFAFFSAKIRPAGDTPVSATALARATMRPTI